MRLLRIGGWTLYNHSAMPTCFRYFFSRPHLVALSLCHLAILLSLTAPTFADSLPEGYTFRRTLNFKQAASDAPGQNAAWAEFYTNGAAKADGSDIRVTTADRVIVPHKILQCS